jgi:hypothetical protein
MRRHIIGIMAIILLLGGVAFWIWPPADAGLMIQLEATCWRIGGCLVVLWLAYPDLRNIPRWIWLTVPVLILILARWPRMFLLAIPLLILYALIRPRISNRSPSSRG